ncbi:SWIM zinc finger family protein [Nocardiopsis lambiniae]|uniref:SWIM zinc finger family protein n=1 Tax=Nocardiopsis lambiniae TaxID=3075539 RepID=A0ABU2M3Y1_9ACTN|nr:SWIM zinc finger family protein [Nocardiopsis sp. DSM 44743]MDT0326855.1 SWIM zinc finger family protein [Nocardiopsis sp. DSM 44743]
MAKAASWPERGTVAAPAGGTSALWGECQGSGSKPYLAAVHLDGVGGTAYKCSCPSRKIPCKHVLGLLALWSQGEVDVREEKPSWVGAWLDGRTARQARAEGTAPAAPVDPAKAAATLRAREESVGAGLGELRMWLYDQIDAGLAEVPKLGYDHWDRMAKRLIDAKAGGASGLVSRLPTVARQESWPERVLEHMSLIHLLIDGYRAGDAVGERTRGAVRSRVGIALKTEEVQATGERVRDTWLVLGRRSVDMPENDVRGLRVWLRGVDSGRTALALSFGRADQAPTTPYRVGTAIDADLAFYPDGHRVVPTAGTDRPASVPEGTTISAALDSFARVLAEDPWRETWPVVLAEAVPARDDRWYLADPSGDALPLATDSPRRLLAVTGGNPSTVAAEWAPGEGLTPIAVWDRTGKAIPL